MLETTIDPALVEQCDNWTDNLSAKNLQLIKGWTQADYRDINNRLTETLGYQPRDHFNDYTEEKLADFLMVLATAPKHNGVMFRGTKKTINQFTIGQKLDFARLTSWAISFKAARQFGRVVYRTKHTGFYIDSASSYGRRQYSNGSHEDESIVAPANATIVDITTMREWKTLENTTSAKVPKVYKLRRRRYRPQYGGYRSRTTTKVLVFENGETKRGRIPFGVPSRVRNGKLQRAYNRGIESTYRAAAQVKQTKHFQSETHIIDLELSENWEMR